MPATPPNLRAWCGLCGTYIYPGDKLPCAENDSPIPNCGAIGRPWEPVETELPTTYHQNRQKQFERLKADAFARMNGVNLDGSPRRETVPAASPRDSQVGGSHYTSKGIQPFEYTLANGLGGLEHTVVKYVTRWKDKGGVQDLKKARHTLDFLIDWVERNEKASDA